MAAFPTCNFVVKYGKEAETIEVPGDATVGELKRRLEAVFGVPFARQKLAGMKKASDDTPLAQLALKRPQRIMLVGPRDEDLLREATAEERAALEKLVDDVAPDQSARIAAHKREVNLDKVNRRVKEYEPRVVAGFRPGKKCIVFDVDYTLFDHRTVVERPHEQARPFALELFRAVFPFYNIVIFSAAGMDTIVRKLESLGLLSHPEFSIAVILDHGAMITVESAKYGVVNTKPLGVLWGKYPEHVTPENSLMVDDLRRNFLMNPKVCDTLQ